MFSLFTLDRLSLCLLKPLNGVLIVTWKKRKKKKRKKKAQIRALCSDPATCSRFVEEEE